MAYSWLPPATQPHGFSALNLVWLLGDPVIEAVVEADKADEFGEPRMPLQLRSLSTELINQHSLIRSAIFVIFKQTRTTMLYCTVHTCTVQRESY